MIEREFSIDRDRAKSISYLADFIVYRCIERGVNVNLNLYRLEVITVLLYLWYSNDFYFDDIVVSERTLWSKDVDFRYDGAVGMIEGIGIKSVPYPMPNIGGLTFEFEDKVKSYDELKSEYSCYLDDIDILVDAITIRSTGKPDKPYWNLMKIYHTLREEFLIYGDSWDNVHDVKDKYLNLMEDKRLYVPRIVIEKTLHNKIEKSYQEYFEEVVFLQGKHKEYKMEESPHLDISDLKQNDKMIYMEF